VAATQVVEATASAVPEVGATEREVEATVRAAGWLAVLMVEVAAMLVEEATATAEPEVGATEREAWAMVRPVAAMRAGLAAHWEAPNAQEATAA
jgi:hypothetical protein